MTTLPGPVVIHGDDEAAVIARLVAAWALVDEDYTPPADAITVGIPLELTDKTAIQVEHEGVVDVDTYPARERNQTRVTCWAPKGKRSWVKALAARSVGELEATPPDAPDTGQEVGSIRLQTGRSKPIQDPDTKNLGIWFLVTTSIRGNQL